MSMQDLMDAAINKYRNEHGESPKFIFANKDTLNKNVREYNNPMLEEFPLPIGLIAKYVGIDVCQDDTIADNEFRCE